MNDNLYNYIYDAMNLALELIDDRFDPVEHTDEFKIRNKLDKAIGKFQDWYDNITEKLQEIQSICIGADSPDANEHAERDPIEELQCCQQDIGAISNITEEIQLIGENND